MSSNADRLNASFQGVEVVEELENFHRNRLDVVYFSVWSVVPAPIPYVPVLLSLNSLYEEDKK
ncbi:MAG: hypothetical protein JNK44_07485 [Cyclobacteriaceae bacterium]|nr:hypothetical protein [Cyclobacteriaceae bacterium]